MSAALAPTPMAPSERRMMQEVWSSVLQCRLQTNEVVSCQCSRGEGIAGRVIIEKASVQKTIMTRLLSLQAIAASTS